MELNLIKRFEKEFGDRFTTDERIIEEKSKAPYLVSPILSKMGKKALGVLFAKDEEDVLNILKFSGVSPNYFI
ncbi:hypothetical protein [Saccharolobus solfataricus]|uniref:FAD/FMN-containing dehydrogenase n=1 Tax=Saccharolobus solfataricus TaxID=2287 RepID=A0A157SYX8_SACSO|nr:hypothetical protein [Saccharolobus solfataricus]SAI84373.1 FAD/FMN-containing dehydrogenase [Saccharolobus solfataricus]